MILSKYTKTIQLHVGLITGLHVIVLSILSYPFFCLVFAIFCSLILLKCQYDWAIMMEERENDYNYLINNSRDSMADGLLSK